jgi:transposase InsO family protein
MELTRFRGALLSVRGGFPDGSPSGSVPPTYRKSIIAMAETFFATLEVELLAKHRLVSHVEVRLAIFCYIEGWYNPHRRHSALGHRSSLRFEALQHHAPTAA